MFITVSGLFWRNVCLWKSRSFLRKYCKFICGSVIHCCCCLCRVAVTRPKAKACWFRSCGSVEPSSAYDLFIYLNLRKCVICICICIYIYVHVHTSLYCRLLLPLHMGLQHTRKYATSAPSIPYLKFYGVIQIGNVSNCKLEVLKNEVYYLIVEKYMGMGYPPKYRFHNCWRDRATYNSSALVFILPCNRTKTKRRSQHRKHACSVETHIPEGGERGNNGFWKGQWNNGMELACC